MGAHNSVDDYMRTYYGLLMDFNELLHSHFPELAHYTDLSVCAERIRELLEEDNVRVNFGLAGILAGQFFHACCDINVALWFGDCSNYNIAWANG